MALKKERLIANISDNLAVVSTSAHIKGTLGLYDSARTAQAFFKGLFNLVFGYDLKELDIEHEVSNFPAIDLGDEKMKISIQVTIDNSSDKIKGTIKVFCDNKRNLYETYDRLIIFILGERKGYTAKFDTKGKFSFDPSEDIWDDNFLLREIDKIDDVARLEEIDAYLKDKLDTYMMPDHLYPQDISDCIANLKGLIPDILTEKPKSDIASRPIPQRSDEFMVKKNELNGISWDFFVKHIRGHLPFGDLIENFLKDPINASQQQDYFTVCGVIQAFYEGHRDTFPTLEDVFRDVFRKIPRNYDCAVSEAKVKIILHNMYFNCDIGDNPDDA